MARDSTNASSFQEWSATLRLAVSALPAFWGNVPRQVLRARQYSHINSRRPNSQPILGNSVPFPFTCHASLRTRVMSVHMLAFGNGGLLYRNTHTHTDTTTRMQAACSFLRIISLWSVSAWLGKAHFLPSVLSLQDHIKQKHSVGHTRSQHMHKHAGYRCFISLQPFMCLPTWVFMQCQTATLNSFRSILMKAQSQGLSLHPLDQQTWLGSVAISNFISLLFPLLPHMSLSPLSPDYPFLFTIAFFLFDRLGLSVSVSLKVLSPSIFTGTPWTCFVHALLFDFFYSRFLIKQLQKTKFASLQLGSHLPICATFLCVLSSILFSFFVSVCSCSAETERSPRTESVGVCVQEWERVCLRASLSLFASVCH